MKWGRLVVLSVLALVACAAPLPAKRDWSALCDYWGYLTVETEEQVFIDTFESIDSNVNEYVSAAELRNYIINLGYRIMDEEVDEILLAADIDGDGQCNYEEFITFFTRQNFGCTRPSIDHCTLFETIGYYDASTWNSLWGSMVDVDSDGYCSLAELSSLCTTYGILLATPEKEAYLALMDTNVDASVSQAEFVAFASQSC